ncbi:MAG: FprA family A-type flavoprotein [Peptoniphilaceae bacterium]|nr:FprA family A-type flavoprotein [Peptoniphilaceae bacterium]MDD7383394.1 FprA family A-type flavoprotein [Peptoniphilaceae bacterium]MDY3738235.1 FprA family A-type flavoprotein [Peptoniphilaceae bacterium]
MFNVRKITDDYYYIGGNDHRLALFENIFPIPDGVSYNSYLLKDEKTVVFDTVDWSIAREFLNNIEQVLEGRDLDYLVINHMEPDHGASIELLLDKYPNLKVISTEKSIMIMRQFGFKVDDRTIQVEEGDSMNFGKHDITFVTAPMVHWPEVMMSYDIQDKILFAADAFGSFKANDGRLFNDEVDFDRDWLDEARRYYTNIVGKYGTFVQAVLKKAQTLEINYICPLHGLVWRNNFGYIIDKYDKWSRYEPEKEGALIVYASMYGNTEYAAQAIATKLCERGLTDISVRDVSNTDVSTLIAETFKYSNLIIASVTYNLHVYPKMKDFVNDMKALNVRNRTVSILENGSWAPKVADRLEDFFDNEMQLMDVRPETVTITSSLNYSKEEEIDSLVDGVFDSIKRTREDKEKTRQQKSK